MRVEELAPEGCAAESSGAATESPVCLRSATRGAAPAFKSSLGERADFHVEE